ncbi:MAG: DUF433 domain-containing protein [Myxococcota bacterium]|nr:DUF433 domain-containing protein [Myxococcota bacterium]
MPDDKVIVRDPDILCGKPSVRGTRLSVEFLLGLWRVKSDETRATIRMRNGDLWWCRSRG